LAPFDSFLKLKPRDPIDLQVDRIVPESIGPAIERATLNGYSTGTPASVLPE
jgi:hypothetical protein